MAPVAGIILGCFALAAFVTVRSSGTSEPFSSSSRPSSVDELNDWFECDIRVASDSTHGLCGTGPTRYHEITCHDLRKMGVMPQECTCEPRVLMRQCTQVVCWKEGRGPMIEEPVIGMLGISKELDAACWKYWALNSFYTPGMAYSMTVSGAEEKKEKEPEKKPEAATEAEEESESEIDTEIETQTEAEKEEKSEL